MKHLLYIFIILTLLLSCREKKNDIVQRFQNNPKISDLNGIPLDSTCHYFPDSLFLDSITHSIDSFELLIRQVSRSYLLYKMKEPILSNYFLDKDIYRITAIRSWSKPICIRIEKSKDDISMTIKILNKDVTGPPISRQSLHYDSLNQEKQNVKFIQNNTTKLTSSVWDSLSTLIDSTNFWKTKPRLDLNHTQIDGSTWIIEGQNKFGYQVKVIPSPRFNYLHTMININEYDLNDRYTAIFLFIFRTAKLTNERLY